MPEMLHYACKSCNYKFKRSDTTTAVLACPYCGSENISRYKPVLANDLLDSISD